MTLQIDRIESPDSEVFDREYVRPSRPVIIRGALDAATCRAATWTPDYLASAAGDKPVEVAVSKSGCFTYHPNGAAYEMREMILSRALELMRSPDTDLKYYVMQRSLHLYFPELVADISVPKLVDTADLAVVNLWLGSAGNVTPLHYDHSNNLLFQSYGKKVILIYPPEQTDYLYPLPSSSRFAFVSELDLLRPDPERFPLFAKADPVEALLEPGDTLFLPAFWWHHVHSVELSISINYWWNSYPSQLLVPNLLRCVPYVFGHNRLANLPIKGGLIALAEHAFYEARTYWLAALCGVAAFEQHVRSLLRMHSVDDRALPGRLEGLYSRLIAVAERPVPKLDASKFENWTRLATGARAADDRRLRPEDVAGMISDVRQFINSAPVERQLRLLD